MPHRLLDPNQQSMYRLSLRVQLSLWVVLIFTLIQWVSTVVMWVFLSSAIYNSFNDFFYLHTIGVSSLVRDELPSLTREELVKLESKQLKQVRFHSFFIDVFETNGQRVLEPGIAEVELDNASILHAIQSQGPVLLEEVRWVNAPSSMNKDHMVVAIQRVIASDGKSYIILQATNDEYAQSHVMQIGQTLLLTSLSAPFLALLAGWFISRIAVAPLTRVQELISGLTPKSLAEPLKLKEHSIEVRDLVAQLDESRNQIRNAFESQARFISNVSHEIKTPIAVMKIQSETIDLEGSSDEVKEFVQSVRDEMAQLGKMIESFLTLTRIEDGAGNMNGRRFAFNDLVMESLDNCLSMAEQNAIEVDPVLFSDDERVDLAVQGDADLLITMLNNLIRNAIRYSPAGGGVRVELMHIVGGEGEHSVEVLVSDQGPGIPQDKIEHIFNRFSQIEGTNRAGRGHGLGLAIAQGIAELHGGSIRVSNNPDKGCTFTIRLPAIARPDMGTSDF